MTTNSELLTMADKLGLEEFRGEFMADELKGLKEGENECGIVNFMLSSERRSHWVAWYERRYRKYYFHSHAADILPQLKVYLGSPIQCHSSSRTLAGLGPPKNRISKNRFLKIDFLLSDTYAAMVTDQGAAGLPPPVSTCY
jgi:hypothetical protein